MNLSVQEGGTSLRLLSYLVFLVGVWMVGGSGLLQWQQVMDTDLS